jgi:NADH-quinone oxidoreductase subunit L
MRIPMVILSVLAIFGGFLAFPGSYNKLDDWLAPWFQRFPTNGPKLAAPPFYATSMLVTLIATAIGFVIAYAVYIRANPDRERVASMAPGLYNFMLHRYYVDELYDFLFVRPVKWGGAYAYRFVERDMIDFSVDGAGMLTRVLSLAGRRVQTGYVRNYALGIMLGAVLLVGYYFVGGR